MSIDPAHCVHHWLIEEVDPDTQERDEEGHLKLFAVCKKCKEKKTYLNKWVSAWSEEVKE